MKTASRIDELKASGRLPSPTGVGLAILRLTEQKDVAIAELSRVLESDPALAGRVLKYANSSQHATRKPVVAVKDGVVRLGIRAVRQLALGFSVVSNHRNGTCRGFDYQAFWARSLARALAVRALSAADRTINPDEAFTCGLLGQIGRLALAHLHTEAYARVLALHGADANQDLCALERGQFDLDHNELTGALLREWCVPDEYVEAVQSFETAVPDESPPAGTAQALARYLHVADLLAAVCLADDAFRARCIPTLFSVAQALGNDADSLMVLYDAVVAEWKEWGAILDVPTAAAASLREWTDRQPRAGAAPAGETPPEPAASPETAAVAAAPAPAAASLRILIVDDNPADQNLLARLLESAGHGVTRAKDGREALAMALERPPHLIVTDWIMPELDGIGLCKALRRAERTQQIYIIVLTACEDEEHLVTAFEAGADDYMVKPFSPRTLKARIRAAQRIIRLQEEVDSDKEEITRYAAELSVMNRKLERAALTDLLTGLPNRRNAMDRLDEEWSSAKRHGRALACMILDLDHFKHINDQYGHAVGDAVLRDTAASLRRLVRRDDIVFRFGGEEFLLLCPDTDPAGARHLGERVVAGVAATTISVPGFTGAVRVSIGLAHFSPDMKKPQDLLKAADAALYAAKRAGRNRLCVAGE
jgi:diguanylate cyclase (GGDEF)-like protein